MTPEEKVRAYDEALAMAKDALNDGTISNNTIAYLQGIFPELKENEDEMIRKDVLTFIRRQGQHIDKFKWHKWIAWLEKQKEFVSVDFDDMWGTADCDEQTAPLERYSKAAIKEMCHAWYDKGIELERKSWIEKQEQKTQGKSVLEASKEFEDVCYEDIEKCAKHFFELGLKTQKKEQL